MMSLPARKHRTVVLALALALGLAGSRSAAEVGTEVESLSADRSGSTISATGTANFVDVPMQVATDGTGDVLLLGQPLRGLGADVTASWLSRPNPFGDVVRFKFEIADMPATGCAPDNVIYWWDIVVEPVAGTP